MIHTRLHRLLIAASLLVPATLFGAAAFKDHRDVLREGEATVTRTAAVMQEHTSKVFETGQLVLDRVDGRIRTQGWDAIAAPETSAFLARIKAPLQQVVSIWVTNAEGYVQAGSQAWDPTVNLSERDFFRVHREADVGTFVSPAFRGRATGMASFALSQRRTTEDGRFDGIVHISLSPDYFTRFFADAAPDFRHAAVLIRSDGQVLARQPVMPGGDRLNPDSPLMRRIATGPGTGYFTATSTLDGIERAYAYRRVPGYPLHVGFGVDMPSLMQQWKRNLVVFGVAAGAASVLLLLLSLLAYRGMQAQRAATARLRAAMDALQHETDQREEAERRVRQAQKMEAVGQLTSGIAHDFNNLITGVLGSLKMLRKRLPGADATALRLLDNAAQSAQRGASLTQRLLAFGRGQALKPQAVGLSALVHGMAELLHGALGAGIRLDVGIPAALPPVLVDSNQLELVLLNLAVNARHAMEHGGSLRIEARRAGPQELRPEGLGPGDYAVLTVSDDGIGMDEATLARSVEPFFTTKAMGKGTGLGLSMVQGFTAQSGGKLVLQSQPGLGTTAELWLPVAHAVTTTEPASRAPETAAAR